MCQAMAKEIYTILLGGGLTKNQWKDNGNDFFLPLQVISKVFRGKCMEELKRLWKEENLSWYSVHNGLSWKVYSSYGHQ